MKRLFLFAFILCLFFVTSCAPSLDSLIHDALSLPMECTVFFSLDEITGVAQLHLTQDTLNLGVSDGVLAGTLISVTAEKTRLLYEGMDVSLSAPSCAGLQNLKKTFAFLSEQHFSRASAVRQQDAEGLLFFHFNDTSGAVVRFGVDAENGTFHSLETELGSTKITLRKQ